MLYAQLRFYLQFLSPKKTPKYRHILEWSSSLSVSLYHNHILNVDISFTLIIDGDTWDQGTQGYRQPLCDALDRLPDCHQEKYERSSYVVPLSQGKKFLFEF